MDMGRLRQIDAYRWTLPKAGGEQRHDIALYGSRELLASMDDKVLEQITNVAQLPGLVGAAMTMPDAHWGYGFPIGGVAAFDPEQGGIISAGGVGFDISCGIRCLRSNVTLDAIAPRLPATCRRAIPRHSRRRRRGGRDQAFTREARSGAARRRAVGGRARLRQRRRSCLCRGAV